MKEIEIINQKSKIQRLMKSWKLKNESERKKLKSKLFDEYQNSKKFKIL